MESSRTTLHELPSGKIEVVQNGVFTILQFNTSCEDAIPFCKGMCCGLRVGYNVLLAPGEETQYDSVPHPKYDGRFMLAFDPADGHCVYQDKRNGFCTIHRDKPQGCREWHCSPEGKGDALTYQGSGWFLAPMNSNSQDKEIQKCQTSSTSQSSKS